MMLEKGLLRNSSNNNVNTIKATHCDTCTSTCSCTLICVDQDCFGTESVPAGVGSYANEDSVQTRAVPRANERGEGEGNESRADQIEWIQGGHGGGFDGVSTRNSTTVHSMYVRSSMVVDGNNKTERKLVVTFLLARLD